MTSIGRKIKVLIVDDSAVVRRALSDGLAKDPEIDVVGTAPDPFVARDKILSLKPDLLLLDIEMPRMDGLTFLEKLMRHYPMPVIVVSSLVQEGNGIALKALEIGAADVVAKPGAAYSVDGLVDDLIEKIKSVSRNKIAPTHRITDSTPEAVSIPNVCASDIVIAMGASTGGTEALTHVLTRLPERMPPILIVQHMPEQFTKLFADRLNTRCALEVREAENMEKLSPGKALIAPGNWHMTVKRRGAEMVVELNDGPAVFHQRPSVEVLFQSVAQVIGRKAIGVLMTGMGKDGASGLLAMRNAGAVTLAQDEKTSVVYGMPKEAVMLGAAQKVMALENIPQALINLCRTV